MKLNTAYSIFMCGIPIVAVVLGTILVSSALVAGALGFAVGALVALGYALITLNEAQREIERQR